jgi:hypothetical protein
MALQPNTGPGLPFWGFLTVTFLQGWIVSPAPNPNQEDQVSVFMTHGDRVTQLYPSHWGPTSVAFYDVNGLQWDYSLIPATTREININKLLIIFDVLIYGLIDDQVCQQYIYL